MSGSNPFRRKQVAQDASEVSSSVEAREARPLGIEIPPPAPRSKGKRVRIISPHSATTFDSSDDASLNVDDSQQYHRHHGFPSGPRSPPPAASLHSILSKGGKINPFDLELSDSSDEDSPLTAVKGDVGLVPIQAFIPHGHPGSLPTNSRGPGRDESLQKRSELDMKRDSDESMRNELSSITQISETPSSSIVSGRGRSPKGSPLRTTFPNQTSMGSGPPPTHRTPMDVDAFKRLLLTGARDPTPTASIQTPPLGQQSSQGDTSSNTDTSSLSRNSILDSQTDLHLETPTSSHDVTPLDEDGQFSFSTAGLRARRSKPPTPPRRRSSDLGKHHHFVNNNDQPLSTQSKTGNTRLLSVVTDLNKSMSTHPPMEVTRSIQPESPLASTFTTITRQRTAPPPPLSRRNSQMRAKQQQFHGVSTSIAEEILPAPEPVNPPPPAINKAPAPPPPRRKGTDRAATLPIDHVASTPEAPAELPTRNNQTPYKAPPPPRLRSGSRAKATKSSEASSGSRSTTIPPPPPSRHRASSSSSHASKRASTEIGRLSSESQRPVPHSVSEDVQSGPSDEQKDILADLSALQKELDAYRTAFGS